MIGILLWNNQKLMKRDWRFKKQRGVKSWRIKNWTRNEKKFRSGGRGKSKSWKYKIEICARVRTVKRRALGSLWECEYLIYTRYSTFVRSNRSSLSTKL